MTSGGSPATTRLQARRADLRRRQAAGGEKPDIPVLPFDAIPYVVRQRTKLQRWVSDDYFELMEREFATLKPFLPAKARRVLDIGGGLGGVDIFISRHYGHAAEIHMLDRVGMDPDMKFGFRAETEKYNDPALTAAYLKNGGVPPKHFTFWDADRQLPDLMAADADYDVILSLKSWAFHYPYAVYAELVSKKLSKDGVMIVDVRKDSGQQDEIRKQFEIVATAASDGASEQLVMKWRGSVR